MYKYWTVSTIDCYFRTLLHVVYMEGITSVVGRVYITGNDALTSLTGLERLTSVGDLHIGHNGGLTSLTGLDGVTSVEREFYIEGNAVLCEDRAVELEWQLLDKGNYFYSTIEGNNGECL